MMKGGANVRDQAEIRRCGIAGESPKALSHRMQIPLKVIKAFYPGMDKINAKKAAKKAKKAARKESDRQMLANARAIVEGVDTKAELSPQQKGALTKKANAAAAKKAGNAPDKPTENAEDEAFNRDNSDNEF